ncbi:MAG: hypothetical protein ABR573_07605 [Candidatus Dormibacteria bacterium]
MNVDVEDAREAQVLDEPGNIQVVSGSFYLWLSDWSAGVTG